MRVLFYTAAALAASLANITHALKLDRADFDDFALEDDFAEVDALLSQAQDPAMMTDGAIDKELEMMERELKQMQEQ